MLSPQQYAQLQQILARNQQQAGAQVQALPVVQAPGQPQQPAQQQGSSILGFLGGLGDSPGNPSMLTQANQFLSPQANNTGQKLGQRLGGFIDKIGNFF